MKKIKAIVAMAADRAIGKGNTLPWHIPAELQWFKKCTLGQVIVMGRKTFESIGRPLPKRISVVLTRSTPKNPVEGVHYINKLSEINQLAIIEPEQEIWICGGAEVYTLALPYCSELYLTKVKVKVDGADAFFPAFEENFEAKELIEENDEYQISRYVNRAPKILENDLVKTR